MAELIFNGYQKNTIKAYDYISVAGIKSKLLSHFYPRFYELKKLNIEFEIIIRVNTKIENIEKQFFNGEIVLNNADIKELKQKEFNMPSFLFDKYKLSYSIEHDYDLLEPSVTIALCADGRTLPYDVFSIKEFPPNYKMIFLLESDAFSGRTEPNRESLIMDEMEKKQLKKDFAIIMQNVMLEEIEGLKEKNRVTRETIRKCYPHLEGFFDEETIGFLDRYAVIQNAQEKFFAAQRRILEADNLTESQYNESLNQASRVLTEYILYRTKIINKLKSITPNDREAVIHNVLAPKGKQFNGMSRTSDIYQNNLWILDDKFMSYLKVLSDFEIETIYGKINVEGSHNFKEKEDGRPDITILFSGEPERTEKIDVVIVELKRLGLDLARKEELISQIKQRARRLMEFHPNKIQRIWFYGIIDFDKEFKVSLIELGYKKLFSSGEIFYNRDKVVINQDTEEMKDIDVFIMEYKTVLEDAEKRNSVFLDLLKESIKKKY